MKTRFILAAGIAALGLAMQAHGHRTTGLLQASLVDVLPSQVGVEVTLVPGIDIAHSVVALLDTDGDGALSEGESDAWAKGFLADQSVLADGKSLPLKLVGVWASSLAEMAGGHAEIVVNFTAELGEFSGGAHSIACINRYEPISSAYQSNGLVPKAPSVRISSHRRDERQQELTLEVEFSGDASQAVATVPVEHRSLAGPSITTVALILGMGGGGIAGAVFAGRRMRSAGGRL